MVLQQQETVLQQQRTVLQRQETGVAAIENGVAATGTGVAAIGNWCCSNRNRLMVQKNVPKLQSSSFEIFVPSHSSKLRSAR